MICKVFCLHMITVDVGLVSDDTMPLHETKSMFKDKGTFPFHFQMRRLDQNLSSLYVERNFN